MHALLTPVTLPTLAATPAALRALVVGLPEDVLTVVPDGEVDAGTWSIQVVAAHLAESHRRQVGRIHRIVTEDRPPILNVEEWDALGASGLLAQQTNVLVDTFAEERLADVEWYATLDDAELARVGLHSVAGEVTVANLLNQAAYHDAQHLGQVARIIEALAHPGRGNMRLAAPPPEQ